MASLKKTLSGFLALAFVLALLAGCTNTGDDADEPTTDAPTQTTELATLPETTYPELKIEITLGDSPDGERIFETMDYYFIPDDEIIDRWEAVDFVQNIDDFEPSRPNFLQSDLYWQSIEFFDKGTSKSEFSGSSYIVTYKWTKGYIIEEENKVIPTYAIKQIAGTNYMFIEWKSGDYFIRGDKPWYYVFKKSSDPEPPKDVRYAAVKPYDDVRSSFNIVGNLSQLDLADFGENMITLTFNEKTIFPPRDKMPNDEKYQPENIMEAGKNPGLGVRALHEQGITGKGVNVAIIDQPLYLDHPEYAGKIIEYKDFDCNSESSMHGPLVTSLLVGETIGTAPGAKVYYAATPSWLGDATYFADAVDWIVNTNENLTDGEKIRVISISGSATPSDPRFTNGEKYLESVKRAKEAGILVLDCSPENGIVGTAMYDYDNPEDVTLCKRTDESDSYPFNVKDRELFAPMYYRTTAEQYSEGDFSYQYFGNGGISSAIPYAAGVLAMGWEVSPELTADEIMQILLDTAYVDGEGNKFICPTAFIDYLKK